MHINCIARIRVILHILNTACRNIDIYIFQQQNFQ
nr:MAG TPA: hypothetical protein [Caudoviricetes sp.]